MRWMVGLLLLSSTAWAGDAERLLAAHDAPAWIDARDALVADAALTEAALRAQVDGDDWRASLTAAAVLAWRTDAAAADAAWTAPTRPSRAGIPVFDARVAADVPAVLAERLVHGAEDTDTRLALIDQLRRTDAPWTGWVAALVVADADPQVRASAAETLRYAEGAAVVDALRAGLTDEVTAVREAAARGAGWSKAGPDLVPALIAATQDPSGTVAGFAARSLGWVGAVDAFDAVAAVLPRVEGRARLDTLRALERLDANRAAAHPAVRALVDDADPKVARAAGQIVGGAITTR